MKISKHHEQASSHGVPGKLDCVPISLPNLSEEPSLVCQDTVHHQDSIGNGDCTPPGEHWECNKGLYTTWTTLEPRVRCVHHLDSIGNGDCTSPGQHWDQELESVNLVGTFQFRIFHYS